MTTVRDQLLILHPKLPTALKRSLANRGLTLIEGDRHPDKVMLSRALACFADFGSDVKHLVRAFRWKARMSSHGVPVVTWNRDAPHNNNLPPWRLALFNKLRLLDLYATHSVIDKRWDFASAVLFLPNAVDITEYNLRGEAERVFARLRDPNSHRWDVFFYGALDGGRYQEAIARQQFFTDLADRLDSLGIRYHFVDNITTRLTTDEQVANIQASCININFGARCDFGGFPPSGLPERCFGIPACGGFLLTDERTHVADSFDIGRHLDTFRDIDDCVLKIRHYLANPMLCRTVAEAGWRHVMDYHTYDVRAKTLHDAFLAWHARHRGMLPGAIAK